MITNFISFKLVNHISLFPILDVDDVDIVLQAQAKVRLSLFLIYTTMTISSMLSKYHFTSVSGSVNICLIIIDNILVLPKVVKSIFETIYRICRDNKTR